jgi:hypothetical protein
VLAARQEGKMIRMKRPGIGGSRLPRWARLTFAALTVVLLLTSVGGAVAASKERVGDRVSLLAPPETYPSGTAFHIWHGFVFQDFDRAYGRYQFTLDVDGIARPADFFEVTAFDRGTVSKVWVFNFPDGLTGTHTFEGHWITPGGTDTVTVTVDFMP